MRTVGAVIGIGVGLLCTITFGLLLDNKKKKLKIKDEQKSINIEQNTEDKNGIVPPETNKTHCFVKTNKVHFFVLTNKEKLEKMSCFKVKCIGGHVGQNKAVILELAILAENGREAARKARCTPRVKHDAKNAILNVTKISFEEYITLKRKNNKNPYFHCTNRQMQREFEENLGIFDIEEEKKLYTKKHSLRKIYNYREPEIERLRGNINNIDLA